MEAEMAFDSDDDSSDVSSQSNLDEVQDLDAPIV
jgi:hypothetical protein